jgi:uncharacterized protein YbaR (Trm112 family)
MAVDQELLDLLVCPKSHGELELVQLPSEISARLVERYKEHFQGELPVVESGLLCRKSQMLYPIVSDIPVMLIEEALPASSLGVDND